MVFYLGEYRFVFIFMFLILIMNQVNAITQHLSHRNWKYASGREMELQLGMTGRAACQHRRWGSGCNGILIELNDYVKNTFE